MDLKELGSVDPSQHWYYQAKSYYLFSKLITELSNVGRIVEIGAGSAFFLKEAMSKFSCNNGVAVDLNYTPDYNSRVGNITYRNAIDSEAGELYLFIDVLEHVENDFELLTNGIKHAPKGAIVLVTVPAFNFLWSAHDEFLYHKRRYRIDDLRKLAHRANLEILDSRYLFGMLFPIAMIKRKFAKSKSPVKSDMRTLNSFLNRILLILFRNLAFINQNKYFGLTVYIKLRVK